MRHADAASVDPLADASPEKLPDPIPAFRVGIHRGQSAPLAARDAQRAKRNTRAPRAPRLSALQSKLSVTGTHPSLQSPVFARIWPLVGCSLTEPGLEIRERGLLLGHCRMAAANERTKPPSPRDARALANAGNGKALPPRSFASVLPTLSEQTHMGCTIGALKLALGLDAPLASPRSTFSRFRRNYLTQLRRHRRLLNGIIARDRLHTPSGVVFTP